MPDIIRRPFAILILLMFCSVGLQAQHDGCGHHGSAHKAESGASAQDAGDVQNAKAPQDAGAVPPGLIEEHEQIHAELAALLDASGAVGTAAQSVADKLHHHFSDENQLAVPPLGWLVPLAKGDVPPGADAMIAKTDSLRAAMPQMLAEHRDIHAAAKRLHAAGLKHDNPAAVAFAEKLIAHARREEEVLYPAAMLVGDVLRMRDGE